MKIKRQRGLGKQRDCTPNTHGELSPLLCWKACIRTTLRLHDEFNQTRRQFRVHIKRLLHMCTGLLTYKFQTSDWILSSFPPRLQRRRRYRNGSKPSARPPQRIITGWYYRYGGIARRYKHARKGIASCTTEINRMDQWCWYGKAP